MTRRNTGRDITLKRPKKQNIEKPASYTARREYIKRFGSAPRGNLTRGIKGAITRKFNELWRARDQTFIRSDRKTIKRARHAGAITTDRGLFVSKGKRQKPTVKNGRINQRGRTRFDSDYYFESDAEKAAFIGDPRGFVKTHVAQVVAENKFLTRGPTKWVYRTRVIYKGRGNVTKLLNLNELEHYMAKLNEDIFDAQTNTVVKTAQQRRDAYAFKLAGLRFVFHRSQLQKGRGVIAK